MNSIIKYKTQVKLTTYDGDEYYLDSNLKDVSEALNTLTFINLPKYKTGIKTSNIKKYEEIKKLSPEEKKKQDKEFINQLGNDRKQAEYIDKYIRGLTEEQYNELYEKARKELNFTKDPSEFMIKIKIRQIVNLKLNK